MADVDRSEALLYGETIDARDINLRIRFNRFREYKPTAIGRPRGLQAVRFRIEEQRRIGAIRVHDPDGTMPGAGGDKRDARSVWGPCRLGIVAVAVGETGRVR